MTTVEELEREFSCSREVAIAFVYKVHAWRGRSPEFMQAQVDRLEALIEKWAASHSRQLWLEAREIVIQARRSGRNTSAQLTERILASIGAKL